MTTGPAWRPALQPLPLTIAWDEEKPLAEDYGEGTVRERITRLLMETRRPLSAREIAVLVGLDPRTGEKEVYSHLRHIAKSIRRKSGGRLALFMDPPRCRDCGYVFRDLREPKKPSRCPRCRSQRIEPPKFYIAEL